MSDARNLKTEEIKALEAHQCTAGDWSQVRVGNGFDPARCRHVRFQGNVVLGDLSGSLTDDRGLARPCGIYDAFLADCEIGNNVRIANIKSVLANYRIGDGVLVENAGSLVTHGEATFGNGLELEAVNEGGGREITLYDTITSQIAYIQAMHRHRPALVDKISELIAERTDAARGDRGRIGPGAIIRSVGEIENVHIGEGARVIGASSLRNGTILSEKDCPTHVGDGVNADGFVIAEGAKVDSGALLSRVYIGQATKCGKQFSGENSLFFANSECFHSEACSVLGGPYTVTHHRSTLLIAALYSFYNAGSGSNKSNHMYKLGPVHQGILERGAKTGSFSYMIFPCRVSPFSVVIGKHMANFDISDFPFSYVTAEEDGSYLTPAMNMWTVGTRRDTEKWPQRDRRKASILRDQIIFGTFTPYTVSRMLAGEATLNRLHEETDKARDTIRHNGVLIKRLLLRSSARQYRDAIDSYLYGQLLGRIDAAQSLAIDRNATATDQWADVGGLLLTTDRLHRLEDRIEAEAATIAEVEAFFREAAEAYPIDEWAFVRRTLEQRLGKSLDNLGSDDLAQIRAQAAKLKAGQVTRILADAAEEFDDIARMGFGADGDDSAAAADFEAVRGTYDGNSFVRKMQEEQPGG